MSSVSQYFIYPHGKLSPPPNSLLGFYPACHIVQNVTIVCACNYSWVRDTWCFVFPWGREASSPCKLSVLRRQGKRKVQTMLRATGIVWLLVVNVVFHIPQCLSALEDKISAYLATDYEKLASAACRNYSLASWNYQTDVDNKTKVEELVSKTVT